MLLSHYARGRTCTCVVVRLRAYTRVRVRGRMTLQLHAVVKYALIIMEYCAILRHTAWSCSKNVATNGARLDLCVKARAT